MEWKAVLSRNAFLLPKFLIYMRSLFRITVLSAVSHIEILSWPFIEKVSGKRTRTSRGKEKKREGEQERKGCAIWSAVQTFKLARGKPRLSGIKIAIAPACVIVKVNAAFRRRVD